MRALKRNKRVIYLCKKNTDKSTGIIKYSEPEAIEINYMPTSSGSQMYSFGIHYSQNLQATVDIEIGKKFSEGDKCYIKVEPPKEHDILCENADYIVSVLPQDSLSVTKLVFVKLTGNHINEDQI